MQDLIKYWPALVILLAGIAASIATFYSAQQDGKQKDRIEEFTKANAKLSNSIQDLSLENKEIGKNIIELSSINNSLGQKMNTIVNENLKISIENGKLSEENNSLGKKIFELSGVVRDLNTGGSSFLSFRHARITLFQDNVQINQDKLHLFLDVFNEGNYSLDNVKIKGYSAGDFRKMNPMSMWTDLSLSGLNIHSRYSNINLLTDKLEDGSSKFVIDREFDVFKPAQSETLGPIAFNIPFEYFGINLYIETKRQDWIALLRFYRPVDMTEPYVLQAFRILKMTGKGLQEIQTKVDEGFPLNENHNVSWFSEELPNKWFEPIIRKDAGN